MKANGDYLEFLIDSAFSNAEFVLDRYDDILKEKITEAVLQTYRNSTMEIERRKLVERAGLSLPRIDYYLYTILTYSFTKLHKGDKVRAYEIINEMKNEILETRLVN
ncbi:MAG: hypothetical protein JNL75_07995 [Chitinophagales bacterium]|nr:hypothetical protein [Chitinophagales bacterium]